MRFLTDLHYLFLVVIYSDMEMAIQVMIKPPNSTNTRLDHSEALQTLCPANMANR